MKVKLINKKKPLPRWDSFCSLPHKQWEKLNAGKTVEVDIIPKPALAYLKKEK